MAEKKFADRDAQSGVVIKNSIEEYINPLDGDRDDDHSAPQEESVNTTDVENPHPTRNIDDDIVNESLRVAKDIDELPLVKYIEPTGEKQDGEMNEAVQENEGLTFVSDKNGYSAPQTFLDIDTETKNKEKRDVLMERDARATPYLADNLDLSSVTLRKSHDHEQTSYLDAFSDNGGASLTNTPFTGSETEALRRELVKVQYELAELKKRISEKGDISNNSIPDNNDSNAVSAHQHPQNKQSAAPIDSDIIDAPVTTESPTPFGDTLDDSQPAHDNDTDQKIEHEQAPGITLVEDAPPTDDTAVPSELHDESHHTDDMIPIGDMSIDQLNELGDDEIVLVDDPTRTDKIDHTDNDMSLDDDDDIIIDDPLADIVADDASIVAGALNADDASIVADEPAVDDASIVADEPALADAPVVDGAPDTNDASVAADEPAVDNASIVADEPALADAPVVDGAPDTNDVSIVADEPATDDSAHERPTDETTALNDTIDSELTDLMEDINTSASNQEEAETPTPFPAGLEPDSKYIFADTADAKHDIEGDAPLDAQLNEQDNKEELEDVDDIIDILPADDEIQQDSRARPSEPITASPVNNKNDGARLQQISDEELKTIIGYMDELLDDLPHNKVEEFAHSQYFELYERLFDELGLHSER